MGFPKSEAQMRNRVARPLAVARQWGHISFFRGLSALSCVALLPCLALLAGCEDGPEQQSFPLRVAPGSDPAAGPSDVYVAGETKGFDDAVGDDAVGSAKFCAETEESELAREMVVKPIVPDVSAGGLPLWSESGGPLYADDVLGLRSDGKFCNPTRTYANAFAWGPTNDILLIFDPETRLVEGVQLSQQYLGSLSGTFSEGGVSVEVVAKPRERLSIGGNELAVYASRAQAASEPGSWLNPENVTRLYRMVRETFFLAQPQPAGFDCVAAQICDVVYTGANEDTPQVTAIALRDSGITLQFTPEGYMNIVAIFPVRSAPFENGGLLSFGTAGGTQMAFGFQSQFRPDCVLDLDSALSWGTFQSRCIASGDERALERVSYNVDTARDAVAVEFNGVSLMFLHDPSQPLLRDGERPQDSDPLYSVGFSRLMPAPVAEFRPLTLANLFKARLEARLRGSLLGVAPVPSAPAPTAPGAVPEPAPGAVPEPAPGPVPDPVPAPLDPALANHPLATFTVAVPALPDTPQRLAELVTPEGVPWIPTVVAQVGSLYAGLTAEQKAVVDPRVQDPVYLIEPFVDSVLFALSHGESDAPGAFKAFRNTEDERLATAVASFRRAGVPYRLGAVYNLNFGAITTVQVSRGESPIDRVIDLARGGGPGPYFEAAQMLGGTALSLGSDALVVDGVDRQLQTLTVSLSGLAEPAQLQVSGLPRADANGYLRQIRGERYEFVPSDQVNLFGKETVLVVWVREDGTIGRLENRGFKGSLELCAGLPIAYGDDLQQKLRVWESSVAPEQYRVCELTFNYSANGNVLGQIASIGNRVAFSLQDGRAITAAVWE